MSVCETIKKVTGCTCIPDWLPQPEEGEGEALEVPGYLQLDGYSCGAIAGWTVVETFHPWRSFDAFYRRCSPDPDDGTSTTRLVRALRSSGLGVSQHRVLGFGEVCRTIRAGFPIIACIDTDTPDVSHWVVVYGFGHEPGRVFLAGNAWSLFGIPIFGEHEMEWSEFRELLNPGLLVCWGSEGVRRRNDCATHGTGRPGHTRTKK